MGIASHFACLDVGKDFRNADGHWVKVVRMCVDVWMVDLEV